METKDMYVNQYTMRVSALHTGFKPIQISEKLLNKEYFSSEWIYRCVQLDWKRNLETYMKKSMANWIVIDLSTILYPPRQYKKQPFSLMINESIQKFYRMIEKDVEVLDYTDNEYEDYYFICNLEHSINMLKEKYGGNIIIVNSIFNTCYMNVRRVLKKFDWTNPKTEEKSKRKNHIMKICENYMQKRLNCYQISFTDKFFSDSFFPGGSEAPLHYEENFYREAYYTILSIIKTQPDQRIFSKYRIGTKINRIIEFGRNRENIEALKKVFQDDFLDQVLLQMPTESIELYKSEIEKIYQQSYNDFAELIVKYDFKKNLCEPLRDELISGYKKAQGISRYEQRT